MKRMIFAVVALLLIGACVPSSLIPIATGQPTIDVAGTTLANALVNPTQTFTAQPTVTPVVATESSATPTASPPPSETATTAASPVPNLTTTPATATEFAVNPTFAIQTVAVAPPGNGTVTPTPEVLTYGTLPPQNHPFSQVTIVNKSRAQAYVSLQVTTERFGPTVIEHFVRRTVKVKAPVGYYLYVAWVGGRKMVGNFRLRADGEITIILYKDRVEIK